MEDYKRFTVSLPQELYEQFELLRNKLKISRSECIRKAMHSFMFSEENIPQISGDVIGCITMILAHEHFESTREHSHEHDEDESHEHLHHGEQHEHDYDSGSIYANVCQTDLIKNNDIQHHYSDIIHSTMHVHLEFEKCMEIIAISGPYERVKNLKKALQRLKSVLSVGFFVADKQIREKEE